MAGLKNDQIQIIKLKKKNIAKKKKKTQKTKSRLDAAEKRIREL